MIGEEARSEEKDMAVWEALAVAAAVGGVSISGAAYWAWRAYRTGQLRGAWLRLRIKTLGGVTTLDKKLRYKCAICQYSLSAHEKAASSPAATSSTAARPRSARKPSRSGFTNRT
jgi:hypothetical protein